MATYKVLQDIESEDKLVGPLSLRQFIYAIVCVVSMYFCFLMVKNHVPYFVVVFLPPALASGFFAFPWGREQPTELWALAKIRFLFKPKRRIWDQTGVSDYVTVTAPKKVVVDYSNGLSETEVSSRLKALADVIDSHGWATKNVNPALVASAIATGSNPTDSDRLVGINTLPEIPLANDTQLSDDVLDEQNSPVAKQFDQMLDQADTSHRERIRLRMSQAINTSAQQPQMPAAPPTQPAVLQSVAASLPAPVAAAPSPTPLPQQVQQNDYWFLNQTSSLPAAQPLRATQAQPATAAAPVNTVAPQPTADEEALLQQINEENQNSLRVNYGNMRALSPLGTQPAPAPIISSPPVTQQPNPATLNYVNNDDLSIATIARQVNENPPNEVVVSLR